MEKTTYTPGPWSVWKFGESSQGTAVGPAQGGLAVAEVVTVTAHGIMTPRSETEGLANARLIAAAPELLGALTALMTRAAHDAETYTADDSAPIWAFISDAADAIAKAREE